MWHAIQPDHADKLPESADEFTENYSALDCAETEAESHVTAEVKIFQIEKRATCGRVIIIIIII